MNENWTEIKRIFAAASELDGQARKGFLDTECGGDAAIRQEVESLLAHHAHEGGDDDPERQENTVEAFQRLGEFDLIDEIGRGGMAVVYRARQESLNRDVAIKVMVERFASPQTQIDRFHREAQQVAKLEHRAIAKVFTDGQQGAAHWFAMELVPGHDLGRELRLQKSSKPTDRPPILPRFRTKGYVTAVARLCREAARGLAHAHEREIVHRDVKPANLLLTPKGQVKIVDFGIARDSQKLSLTRSGEILGSLPYMSPEQAQLTGHEIDLRTDVYSIGVVLYQLLSLELPYPAESLQDVVSRATGPKPKRLRATNPRVPRDLEIICSKSIELLPANRYASCEALADDLNKFLHHEAISARAPTVARRGRDWLRAHRLLVAVVAALIISALVTTVVTNYRSQAQEIDDMMQALQPWTDPSIDLATKGMSELAGALTVHDKLIVRAAELSGADVAKIKGVGDRIRTYARDLHRQGIIEAEQSRPIPGNPQRETLDSRRFLGGMKMARRAAGILNDPDILVEMDQTSFLPAISVTALSPTDAPLPGRALWTPIDPIRGTLGQSILMGDLPIQRFQVEPGPCRIIVELTDGRTVEFMRSPRLGLLEMTVKLQDVAGESRPTAPMVQFSEGGTLEVQEQEGLFFQPLAGRQIPIPPFEIDKFEVTVGDYRMFLSATQHEPPPLLETIIQSATTDRLPITNVSWEDAAAYAEWVGKRLPSYAEWTFAARGAEMRSYPWKQSNSDDIRGNVLIDAEEANEAWRKGMETEVMQTYLNRAVAVDSMPEAATPEGVHHMLGNVAEWLETPCPDGVHPHYIPRPTRRIMIGGMWDIVSNKKDLSSAIINRGMDNSYTYPGHGFRCARSL